MNEEHFKNNYSFYFSPRLDKSYYTVIITIIRVFLRKIVTIFTHLNIYILILIIY